MVVHMAYYWGANMVLYLELYIIDVPPLGGTRGGAGCTRATYNVSFLDPQIVLKIYPQSWELYAKLK